MVHWRSFTYVSQNPIKIMGCKFKNKCLAMLENNKWHHHQIRKIEKFTKDEMQTKLMRKSTQRTTTQNKWQSVVECELLFPTGHRRHYKPGIYREQSGPWEESWRLPVIEQTSEELAHAFPCWVCRAPLDYLNPGHSFYKCSLNKLGDLAKMTPSKGIKAIKRCRVEIQITSDLYRGYDCYEKGVIRKKMMFLENKKQDTKIKRSRKADQ